MKRSISWLNHLINFIAVILGVFLAFYISERAAGKDRQKEVNLFKQSLQQDLKDDVEAYSNYHIPINAQAVESIDSLIILLGMEDLDAVNNKLSELFSIENYTPMKSTYEMLASTGKIAYFDDLPLQKKLSDYYSGTAEECAAKNQAQVNFFIDDIVPWMVTNSDFSAMTIYPKSSINELKNLLVFYQVLVAQKNAQYQQIQEEATALLEALD